MFVRPQVEARLHEGLEHRIELCQVHLRSADGGLDLRERGLGLVWTHPAGRLEEDARGDLLMQASLFDRICRRPIENDGVSVSLAGDIGLNRHR